MSNYMKIVMSTYMDISVENDVIGRWAVTITPLKVAITAVLGFFIYKGCQVAWLPWCSALLQRAGV